MDGRINNLLKGCGMVKRTRVHALQAEDPGSFPSTTYTAGSGLLIITRYDSPLSKKRKKKKKENVNSKQRCGHPEINQYANRINELTWQRKRGRT